MPRFLPDLTEALRASRFHAPKAPLLPLSPQMPHQRYKKALLWPPLCDREPQSSANRLGTADHGAGALPPHNNPASLGTPSSTQMTPTTPVICGTWCPRAQLCILGPKCPGDGIRVRTRPSVYRPTTRSGGEGHVMSPPVCPTHFLRTHRRRAHPLCHPSRHRHRLHEFCICARYIQPPPVLTPPPACCTIVIVPCAQKVYLLLILHF